MIKYNYQIRRHEGSRDREYVPRAFPVELPELVMLQGPNSSGKSTLLNLLALGLFARKMKNELHPSLLDRIAFLLDSDHQRVQFDFQISNPVAGISLHSSKSSFDKEDIVVRLREGTSEHPITYEEFRKRFRLLYDIPVDPLERLPGLLKEVETSQRDMSNQLEELSEHLRRVVEEIRNAKDPELQAKLKTILNEKKEESEQVRTHLTDKKRQLHGLEKFLYLKNWTESLEDLDKLQKKEDENVKDLKDTKTRKRKESKAINQLAGEIKGLRTDVDKLHRELSRNLALVLHGTDFGNRIQIWKDGDPRDEIFQPSANDDLRKEATEYLTVIDTLLLQDVDARREARFLTSLLQLIQEFVNTKITIPATDKSIDEFAEILRTELRKYESVLTREQLLGRCKTSLIDFQNKIADAIEKVKDYKRLVPSTQQQERDLKEFTTSSERLSSIEDEMDSLREKAKTSQMALVRIGELTDDPQQAFELARNDIELVHYALYSELQLQTKKNEMEKETSELESRQIKLQHLVQELEEEIDRIERKEPHKYQERINDIEKLFQRVQRLATRFSVDFRDCIDSLRSNRMTTNVDAVMQKRYAEAVASFLGEKVRFIRHVDEVLEIESIDVGSKLIKAKGGLQLKFSDLGTGQGQGAYLEGLLSVNDDRMVIALLDEVAMMDSTTLGRVAMKLRNLHRSGKLLAGIIVQKADDPSTISLLE